LKINCVLSFINYCTNVNLFVSNLSSRSLSRLKFEILYIVKKKTRQIFFPKIIFFFLKFFLAKYVNFLKSFYICKLDEFVPST